MTRLRRNTSICLAAESSNAWRTLITLSTPEPTTVTTINRVVVRIILTEMLGPPRAMSPEIMPPLGELLPFAAVDNLAPALQQFLTEFKRVSNAIVDSYFIVDNDRRIVDFNRAFYALLPRAVARGLKGKHCFEVLELNICANECIAQQCWADNR